MHGEKAKRKNNDNNHDDDDDNDNETLDLQTTQHTHASIICTENSPRKWNWIGNILNSFLKLQQIYLGLRKTNEWTIEHFVPGFFCNVRWSRESITSELHMFFSSSEQEC